MVVSVVLGPAVSAQTVADIAVRDRLIADQENLLNTYRCLFGVDTDVVPGGCPTPDAVSAGVAPQNPTQQDIEVRDGLIQSQEALLNTYRCRFDIDTEVVPGGCVDGVPEPTVEAGASTGYTPGDSGPGWRVDGNGRVVLTRLMTPAEGVEAYVAAGVDRELAGIWWTNSGFVGGIENERGARYPVESPFRVGERRLLAWAQGCVSAQEDAGVPEVHRNYQPNYHPSFQLASIPAGLAAFCSRRAHFSGKWNMVVDIYGVDQDCLYDHLIEFLPVMAGRRALLDFPDMGHHGFDFWWGSHCEMRVSHPLGTSLVLGPFGTTGQWTYDLLEEVKANLFGDWALIRGTECSTPIGTLGNFSGTGIQRPRIDSYVIGTLRAINSGTTCWAPGTEPWTTAELDRLGIRWDRVDAAVSESFGGRIPVGTLEVWMRFLPDPHPTVQGYSSPAPAYANFTWG